jgi:hypothetical protein
MFKDTLNEDVGNEGWFLQAVSFLWQAFEFTFDGTRNPATESQQVDWPEHHRTLIERGHFHRSYRMCPDFCSTP